MIPSDRLEPASVSEEFDDGELASAQVTIADTDADRRWRLTAEQVDGQLVLERFSDSATTVFERDAFGAFWFAVEELHDRDIYPDMGPFDAGSRQGRGSKSTWSEGDLSDEFATVVEHEQEHAEENERKQDTDTDTPADADTEAPQPESAVSDGGAVPATQHDPDTLSPVSLETECDEDEDGNEVEVGEDISHLVEEDEGSENEAEDERDEDTVEACPECDGTTIYARETKPDDERWRCSTCEAVFAEPLVRAKKISRDSGDVDDEDDVDLPDERPQWLAGSPEEIVEESKTYLPLDAVIEAVIQEEDVPNVARRLGRSTSDVRGTVLQPLGLLDTNGEIVNDETLDERLEVITRWDDGE